MLKRIALSLALLVGFAIPAAAESCTTLTLEQVNADTFVVTDRTGDGPAASVVATFVQYGGDWDVNPDDLKSEAIPDGAVSAVVCEGGVSFTFPEPEPADVGVVETVEAGEPTLRLIPFGVWLR